MFYRFKEVRPNSFQLPTEVHKLQVILKSRISFLFLSSRSIFSLLWLFWVMGQQSSGLQETSRTAQPDRWAAWRTKSTRTTASAARTVKLVSSWQDPVEPWQLLL